MFSKNITRCTFLHNSHGLKFVEETKQMDRKQETRNQMNKEREYVQKTTETVNRSNLGTVVDVYA